MAYTYDKRAGAGDESRGGLSEQAYALLGKVCFLTRTNGGCGAKQAGAAKAVLLRRGLIEYLESAQPQTLIRATEKGLALRPDATR